MRFNCHIWTPSQQHERARLGVEGYLRHVLRITLG